MKISGMPGNILAVKKRSGVANLDLVSKEEVNQAPVMKVLT